MISPTCSGMGWSPGTYTIIRRVRVLAEEISRDPRSRRRRTIPNGQLALALEGVADHAWAVSFLVANIPTDEPDGIGRSSSRRAGDVAGAGPAW
ncbi:hypothetical protein FRAHR75_1170021 [Frankia sp. Hr75.2]|uniref:hypothetical protein n=1 Tax=Parafrankia sp. Ea1.12 TaxID=573499 RepID=UPI00103DAE1A|nr:hypothetical protein [Parafrankia sp. Ea1.12]TCJ33540.1 hypothetical protein E0504_37330 [Parafrankia sp. BMG5.11]CAI7973866.1 hypothetical protein FRAHR75_1170021 [Frankia sp. Hr75.2]